MKYRTYNTETGKLGRILDNTIGLALEPNEVLLEVVIEAIPTYDENTQWISMEEEINLTTEEWIKKYIIHDKTTTEIEREDWVTDSYAKRVIAPIAMITDPNDNNGVKMYSWFKAQGLPSDVKGDNIRLYCNTIRPEHQYLVDQYGGIITIEDYPE